MEPTPTKLSNMAERTASFLLLPVSALANPIEPRTMNNPDSMNAPFINSAVFPSPSPLICCVIGEYDETVISHMVYPVLTKPRTIQESVNIIGPSTIRLRSIFVDCFILRKAFQMLY